MTVRCFQPPFLQSAPRQYRKQTTPKPSRGIDVLF